MDIYLDGTWDFIVDTKDEGFKFQWYSLEWLKNHKKSFKQIQVPSNFNSIPELNRYAGVVWYIKKIPEIPYRPKSHEYSIEFEAVNYDTQVWLNGHFLGENKGDFLPFRFIFNPRLISITKDNYLVVRVSNKLDRNGVPSDLYDWFNWGGIHRTVKLLILEKTRVTRIKIYSQVIPPDNSSARISVSFSIKNPQEFLDRCYAMQIEPQVEWELYYLGQFFNGEQQFNQILIQTGIQDVNPSTLQKLAHISHDYESLQEYFKDIFDEIEREEEPLDLESYFSQNPRSLAKKGIKKERRDEFFDSQFNDTPDNRELLNNIQITLDNPSCWTPETPDLYLIKLHLNGIDEDKEIRFGIREIKTLDNSLLLNNNPLNLVGVTLHEEKLPFGRHYSLELRRKEIIRMKSLGINFLYTHYPHDRKLLALADEEGILIMEELPLFWDVKLKNSETSNLATKMLYTMIKRDFNHPSIIIWSLGYEIPVMNFTFRKFLNTMISLVKRWDSSRLVSFIGDHFVLDPIRRNIDIVCINLKFGLYYSGLNQISWILDLLYSTQRNKPWIITEFPTIYDEKQLSRQNLKEIIDKQQMQLHYNHLCVFNSKPYISGYILGYFRDFLSPIFSKKKMQGYCHKGIFTKDDESKKIIYALPPLLKLKKQILYHFHFNVYIIRYFMLIFEILNILGAKFKYFFLRKKIHQYYYNNLTLEKKK
ncbi:MAG: hypothetical protein K9W44_12550 [Candidatus Lokiarchaeota archaeon]|nr:hypothetical protein [Candidatus Harpocratesius repetitus]